MLQAPRQSGSWRIVGRFGYWEAAARQSEHSQALVGIAHCERPCTEDGGGAGEGFQSSAQNVPSQGVELIASLEFECHERLGSGHAPSDQDPARWRLHQHGAIVEPGRSHAQVPTAMIYLICTKCGMTHPAFP